MAANTMAESGSGFGKKSDPDPVFLVGWIRTRFFRLVGIRSGFQLIGIRQGFQLVGIRSGFQWVGTRSGCYNGSGNLGSDLSDKMLFI